MTLVSIEIIGLADIILRFLLTPEHCTSEVNSESLTDTRPAGFLLLEGPQGLQEAGKL